MPTSHSLMKRTVTKQNKDTGITREVLVQVADWDQIQMIAEIASAKK
jgi:hypothetical protein